MGWFWDAKDGNQPGGDAYKKLDPALREFLDKESPLKYEDTKPKAARPRASPPANNKSGSEGAPGTFRSPLGLDASDIDQQKQDSESPDNGAAVPAASLFQDGRYAHLWKGYRPQAEVEAASRTDQDRLAAVVEAYQDRKAAIGRAAVENCVEFQMAEKECFASGDWKKRLTMCRSEAKAFNRCYNMQGKFLKALGYLATQRTEEEEERIQMHADKLYHEMLERERAAEEAKKQGIAPPAQSPLLAPDTTMQALGEDSAWARARRKAQAQAQEGMSPSLRLSAYPPAKQEEMKKRLEGLSEAQRELELQLMAAEERATMEYAEQVAGHHEHERRQRAERRERGKETIGDAVKRLWGWDK